MRIIHLIWICALLFSSCSLFRSAPPGTIDVDDQDFSIDRQVVSNEGWAEYLFWLQAEFSDEANVYLAALPDRKIWESVYGRGGNDFKDVSTFMQQRYRNFPVVGVSYEQAKHYCHWRGNRVRQSTRHDVVYSLPTADQYTIVINQYGFRDIGQTDRILPINELPATNEGNIRGLCVNVSEMTNEKGVAVGGNWRTPSTRCPVFRDYDGPQNWLGFRCVAE